MAGDRTEAAKVPGAANKAARQHLVRGAIRQLLMALLLRLAVFQALVFLRDSTGEPVRETLHALSGMVSLILGLVLLLASLSEFTRRLHSRNIMTALAVLTAYTAALDRNTITGRFITPERMEEMDMAGMSGPEAAQALSMSVDCQPTMFVALPVGALVATLLPAMPGATLAAMAAAAAAPYLQAWLWLVMSGWETLSLGMSLASAASGFFSAWALWWLICDVRKLATGATLFNRPVYLKEPSTGDDAKDQAYVAVTAMADMVLMPLWLFVMWARTCVWVLTFGTLCSRKPLRKINLD